MNEELKWYVKLQKEEMIRKCKHIIKDTRRWIILNSLIVTFSMFNIIVFDFIVTRVFFIVLIAGLIYLILWNLKYNRLARSLLKQVEAIEV